jgi:hypothetical protein
MLGLSLALTAIRQGSSSPVQLPFEDNLIVFAGQSHMNGAAGTANITTLNGNACTDVPLQQGYNPIACRLVSTGGTADNIWALI